MADYAPLIARFGDRLRRQEPLARHTTARLGGPADALLTVRTVEELTFAAAFAWEAQLPCRILGGGTNVLPRDAGFPGLVIVNRADAVRFEPDGLVVAESGANFSTLARRCMSRGLSGLTWAVSVPGTVGGAAINNAGAHGGDMAASLRALTLYRPDGSTTVYSVDDLDYGYRHSVLKGQGELFVVTDVTLYLEPGGDPAALKAEADGYVTHRKQTQPPGATLGSIFKNPPGDYAGRLIEAAGLKGEQRGGVMISPVHANFFVHVGAGSAADYVALIELAQAEVQAQFDVMLEPEIQIL